MWKSAAQEAKVFAGILPLLISDFSRPLNKIVICSDASPSGLGISILSTSKGIMSDHEARQENVGGEILCKVF